MAPQVTGVTEISRQKPPLAAGFGGDTRHPGTVAASYRYRYGPVTTENVELHFTAPDDKRRQETTNRVAAEWNIKE